MSWTLNYKMPIGIEHRKQKQRQTESRQHERQTSNRNEHEIYYTHPGSLSELQAILNGNYFE